MKARLLLVTCILVLSLGLASAALAAANSLQQPTRSLASSLPFPAVGGLTASVNYAHNNVVAESLPNVAITVTVAGKDQVTGHTDDKGEFRSWEWTWNDPKGIDINPGDAITVTTPNNSTAINPVGTITGKIDPASSTISGTIQAPFGSDGLLVRCEVWVKDGPPGIELPGVSADGGAYTCDFGAEGWTIQPGQDVAVIYFEPDGDNVINVFQQPYMLVNYAHDWVGANYPAGATFWITVTNSTGDLKASIQQASTSGGGWGADGFQTEYKWKPKNPDIQSGDYVHFATDDGFSDDIQVGEITGTVDSANDSITGGVHAPWLSTPTPLSFECDPWGGPPNTPSKTSSAGSDGVPPYFCQWDPNTEWDIQPGQDIAAMYIQPNGDRVMSVFHELDMNLHLRVNYGHDWVEGNYPSGHSVWITVTQSDQVSVVATAHGVTGLVPWWNPDQTGFSTNQDGLAPWDSGIQPDIQAGDWVFGRVDSGYSAAVHLGTITGTIDLAADSITGGIYTPWLTDTLDVECLAWGPNGGPNKQSTAGTNGDPQYSCQWDPINEWDILAGEDVGVAYTGPDGNWVANAFRVPAPHLWINTWADGNPGTGGNFAFNVQYQNDGDGAAANAVITDTLSDGMTYISDTSGITPSGTGAPGSPLVWQLGDLAVSQNSVQFQVFVKVTADAGETITNKVQIETSTVYSQKDQDRKTSEWSGQVQQNDTHLNVNKNAWTWDPLPGYDTVYNINVCNNGSTASSELTLTDTLPVSTTLVGWWTQNPGWSEVSKNLQELVVARPSIQGYWCTEVYVRVTLDANAQPDTRIPNTAAIYADNNLDPDNNQSTALITVGRPHENLSIDKDWTWGNLTPGGSRYYNLTYRNNGNLPEADVFITSTLPAHTTFLESFYFDNDGQHPITPTAVVPGQHVVWDMDKLDNGYSGNMVIHLGIDAGTDPGTVLTHTAAITSLPVEDDFEDNQITWVEAVSAPGPNLRIDKQSYQWWGDGTLNFELRLENLGTQTLQHVWITDTYPAGTTFNNEWNVTKGGWTTMTQDLAKHLIFFEIDQINPGDIAGVSFRVNLDTKDLGMSYTNHAAAPIAGDVYPADNVDDVTALTGPDLYVTKSLASGDLLPGSLITYTLKFGASQNGNSPWNMQGSAWLTDTLPSGLDFVSAQQLYCGPTIWCDATPDHKGNQLRWILWPFGPGQHNEIRLTARITDTATGLDTLLNQVDIASDQPEKDVEADYANNHASLSLPIDLPYFRVGKTYQSSKIAGMPITYTLTVTNNGFGAGTQIDLRDQMPGNMTYVSGGTYTAGTVKWTLPKVAGGGHGTAWFTGNLQCSVGAVVDNQNYFVAGSGEGITSTKGAPLSFSILAPSIDVGAQASAATIKPGQSVVFTATATTNGTPLTYQWKIGTTVIGSGKTISRLFNLPGTYTVTVTGTDGCGFTDTYSLQIVVSKLKIFLPL